MNQKCALSINEFCESHDISRTQFYSIMKNGIGPEIMKVGKRTLISIEAAEQWRKRLTKQHAAESKH